MAPSPLRCVIQCVFVEEGIGYRVCVGRWLFNALRVSITHMLITNLQDTTAPTVTAPPIRAECNSTLPSPTALDQCDANPTIAFTDVRANGTCSGQFTITRSVIATDACNNSAIVAQTIPFVVRIDEKR